MTDKNMDTDILAEELLSAYGKALCKSQDIYFEKMEDGSQPDPAFFAEKPRKKTRVRYNLRRAMIIVAILILAFAIAMVSSTGFREKMLGYIMTDHAGYTDLSSLENSSDEDTMPEFKLGYVPDGYKLSSRDSDAESFSLSYSAGTGNDAKYINLSVYKEGSLSVDNDTLKRKEVTVNGYQAFVFYDKDNTGVIWQVGGYTFNMWTQLSQKETVKIARNTEISK